MGLRNILSHPLETADKVVNRGMKTLMQAPEYVKAGTELVEQNTRQATSTILALGVRTGLEVAAATKWASNELLKLSETAIEPLCASLRNAMLAHAEETIKVAQATAEHRTYIPSYPEIPQLPLDILKSTLIQLRRLEETIPGFTHQIEPLIQKLEHLTQSAEILSGQYRNQGESWQSRMEEMGFEIMTPDEAAKTVESDSEIYINLNATGPFCTMSTLVNQVVAEVDSDPETARRGIKIVHLAAISSAYSCGLCRKGKKYRKYIRQEPIFRTQVCTTDLPANVNYRDLYEQMLAMETGQWNFDVAIIQIPPPINGKINLGPDVGGNPSVLKGIMRHGGRIIFEVNPSVPYAPGKEIDLADLRKEHGPKVCFVQGETNLNRMLSAMPAPTPVELQIAKNVAQLIKDDDTVQMGIGSIPAVAMEELRKQKKKVKIYSEIIADGILAYFDESTEEGRENIRRFIHEGLTIKTGLAVCSRKLFEFARRYPQLFEFRPTVEINNPMNIARNPDQKAVNAALTVTFGGQVTAFTLDGKPFSGKGGASDFPKGANLSYDTQLAKERISRSASIVTLPSTATVTAKFNSREDIPPEPVYAVLPGDDMPSAFYCLPESEETPYKLLSDSKIEVKVLKSRITPAAGEDAVVQGIGDVGYVVTEYGATPLMKQMKMDATVEAIIGVAHPIFRDVLRKRARQKKWLPEPGEQTST